MSVTAGNEVKFCYVLNELPASMDDDTVYLRRNVGIYVGGELVANSGLVASDLDVYEVQTVLVEGTGDAIVDVNLVNGVLTLTKGDAGTIAKGTDTSQDGVVLTPGGSFTTMVDTTVGDHTIADVNREFTLPDAISDVAISEGTNDGEVKVTVTWAGGTTSITEAAPKGLGDAAYTSATDYATAAQGTKADNAMPAENGTATGATISLAAAPANDMDAVNKKYVDDLIATLTGGGMHFRGESTTEITDGGTENPTIGGESVTNIVAGDCVFYDGKEFVWDGAKWVQLGDEGSYALKTVTITGADGLQGGGNLSTNQTIIHTVPAGAVAGDLGSDTALEVIKKVTTDKFGHVTGVTTEAITVPEYQFADSYDAATNKGATVNTVANAITALSSNPVGGSGNYIASISQTDGVVAAVVGTKGTITAGDTNLVDGDTVNTAVEALRTELQLVWEVIQ